ncbi:MAG TPA: hypothetical protein DEH78_05400, partial [Solibacterales bacterium]|nr:hypothetical protein [Bryobacterales bacterium]
FQGRYSDAVSAFEKAVELSANNYLYWGNLADAYRWMPGRREKARETYARAIELSRERLSRDKENLELRGSLAVYLAKSGDAKAATAEVAPLESSPKASGSTWFKVLLVQELAGDRDRALAALERSLKGGYAAREIRNEPELTALRADARYHKIMNLHAPRQGR